MTLAAGQTLSFYEILGSLGAGAMGEVYRALDTRLEREVAIKVLPEHLAHDEELLARFEREAKSLASLNHSSVAQIYGVDQIEDVCFLVLELVPGETLEERIDRGALAPDEAIEVCRQIADGLAAAHDAGVIHRDLKPANVRITPEGQVKVLDFGLAKPTERGRGGTSITDSVIATREGRVLGTPVYMAPEQARGKSIDRRVDMWAFGCVLYECLTGRRAFTGESVADVIAAVLNTEPDWDVLPAATPPRVRRVLARCMEKDPSQRLRDAADAGLLISTAVEEPAASATGRSGAQRVAVLLTGLVAGAGLGFLARGPSTAPDLGATRLRAELALPAHTAMSPEGGPPAVSPDGRRVAFVALDGSGESSLWVRSLDDGEMLHLPDTTGAAYPCWSPDGERLAFGRATNLYTMGTDESRPQLLAETGTQITGASWNERNQVLYAVERGPLMLVDARGGAPEVALQYSTDDSLWGMWPTFLPGGRRFVFAIQDTSGRASGLYAAELGSTEKRLLLSEVTNAVFVEPGWLLHRRGDAVYATAFDPASMQLGEASERIVKDVVLDDWPMHARFGASRAGRLVFQRQAPGVAESEFVWFDPEDGSLERLDCEGVLWNPRLSRDGTKLAFDRSTLRTSGDVWVRDLVRNSELQLTSAPSDDSWPLWTMDDREVYFYQTPHLHRALASGVGGPQTLFEDATDKTPLDLTADGRRLLYRCQVGQETSVRLLDLDTHESVEVLAGATNARLSEDEAWIAVSVEIGTRVGVGIASFPDGEDLTILPTEWAERPMWSRDGKEIVFLTRRRIMATSVELAPGEPPVLGEPRELLSLSETPDHYLLTRGYDLAPDGKRLLLVRSLLPFGRDALTLLDRGLPAR